MKKLMSLIIVLAMVCTISPAFTVFPLITANAANQTFYYGFEDGNLPSEMVLTGCNNITYTNGIFSYVPATDDSRIALNKTFSADEVNVIKIRMRHNLVSRNTPQVPEQIQVYYQGTNASGGYLSGDTNKLTESNSVKVPFEALSTDGKYITYTVDFTTKANWAGSTITKLRIDPVNCLSKDGDTVDIDYIMLCKKADGSDPIISYEFETDNDYEGFSPVSGLAAYTDVSDGCLNYSNPSGTDTNIYYYLPITSLSTNTYEYVEVLMKHDFSISGKTSDRVRLYIEATLADGTINKIINNSDAIITDPIGATSNGEFKRYIFNLTELYDGTSLLGATITKLRLDPISYNGTASIDSVRIVPYYVQYESLDNSKTTLTYTFANNDVGCAKGIIKIDFGGQNPLFAKNVELMWASGNAIDGYTALTDYSSITSKTGAQMSAGYEISRPLYIPEGTTALIARVTDVEKTFDLVVDIPSNKVHAKTEPKFVAALASDFHFGDSTVALTTPAQKYYDLQTHVQANADTMLVAGDFVQFYGVRSRDEYYYLEYLASGGTAYTNYANYDPTALPSQWDMAMEYFKGWDIPVFIVEGNHETPSAGRQAKGHTGQYMKDWMTEWVNYTNNQSMYDEFTVREKHIYDNTYEYSTNYDNYVTGSDGTRYHVIGMRNLHMGDTRLRSQELKWLDKKLYESEATGTPTFLMIHVPFQGTFSTSNTFSDSNFKAVVNKHPNTIIVSGHTHYSLYSDYQLAINGAGDEPSYIHDGSVVDTGIYYPETDTSGPYSKNNCELVYAEVYEDRIVSRAYDVIKGKYIATNTNQITLKDETAIGDISVTKTAGNGSVTLAANCETEGVTYQWYVGGEETGSGATITLPDTCTEFVAVRVTDASGSFRSESFDSIYDADILYDEGRTYFLNISDADGYNSTMSCIALTTKEWKSVAGKSDNVYHMAYKDETKTNNRSYFETNRWTQINPKSKYIVFKFNAMPLNNDTTVYLATRISTLLSKRVALNVNEWNNVVVVWDIENHTATSYINGVAQSPMASTYFWNNTDASKNGIIRLCIATLDDSSVNCLEAYVDDFEIYETVNAPVIAPIVDMERAEVSGTNAYSSENKLAYVPAGSVAGNISKAFWCVVVDKNGATKASDAVVADTDMLMYYDTISESYNYYKVKTYASYSSLFMSGAYDGVFTASDVKLYVNAKTAGDTVIVAQYDSGNNLVKVQYNICDTAGLNEIIFTKEPGTSYASVFVLDGINTIKPLTEKVDVLVK